MFVVVGVEGVRELIFSFLNSETSIAEEVMDEFMSAEGRIILQAFELKAIIILYEVMISRSSQFCT